jgi:hypothetical protein
MLIIGIVDVMEQRSASEADSRSAGMKVSCLLWRPKVHCFVHTVLPLNPVIRMNAVHTLTATALKSSLMYFYHLCRSFTRHFKFSNQTFYEILINPMLYWTQNMCELELRHSMRGREAGKGKGEQDALLAITSLPVPRLAGHQRVYL